MKNIILAFLMGLSSELYVTIPALGIMPMFDVFSYAVAPILIVIYWSRMGHYMRTALGWGFAWAIAALLAGITSDASMRDVIKQSVVVSSSWALMSVAWLVLRNGGKLYLVYLTGYSVGAYIGLYYFKQGVWQAIELAHGGMDILEVMVDKQRYPIIANLYFYGIVLSCLLLIRKFPTILVSIGCCYCGLFLLMNGGARSNFGFYMTAMLVSLITIVGRRSVKMVEKNKFLFVICGLVAVGLIFGLYKHMAQSGALGEVESRKYQAEFIERSTTESGLLGRAGFSMALMDFCKRPWGNGPHHGQHSVIMSAMAREGVIGLVLWIYFLVQILWFVQHRLFYAGRFAPFMTVMITTAAWACLGSPFGYRHTFFVLWAFITLCRDNPYYGTDDVFTVDHRNRRGHAVMYKGWRLK